MSKKVDFDKFSNEYDDLLSAETKFFTSNTEYFAEYKIKLLDYIIKKSPKKILEFGCGTGRNIKYLVSKYPKAYILGTDISLKSLSIAKLNNPTAFFLHESESLDIGNFDLIFVAGVFHHIEPRLRTKTLKLLGSRLEAAGQLVIFEHNPYNPLTRSIVSSCIYDEDAVLLSAGEIKLFVGGAGLTGIKSGYCLFIPPLFKKIIWLESFLKKIPLGGQHWTCLVKR